MPSSTPTLLAAVHLGILWYYHSVENNTKQRTAPMPFQKGKSGNPGRRPKIIADVREFARAHTATAMNTLVEIAENKKAPPAARVAAANSLLDRGYGKPEAKIEANFTATKVIRAPAISENHEEWTALYVPEHLRS
jgi:hypothetical protein